LISFCVLKFFVCERQLELDDSSSLTLISLELSNIQGKNEWSDVDWVEVKLDDEALMNPLPVSHFL
jgi:hypothetical protein